MSAAETKRIANQLKRSLEGVAWHGPSLKEVLDGVNAEIAIAKPSRDVHSIWELVLHIAFWQDIALKRTRGEEFDEPLGVDWPDPGAPNEVRWRDAVSALAQSGQHLIDAIRGLSEDDLDRKAAGKDYSIYFLLHGVVQHNLYHAGQIAILKKLQAAR